MTLVAQPATLWVPERRGSYGPEIIDWNDKVTGIRMDATQRRDIDCFASYGPGGNWLTLETLHVEGRQNGKTSGCAEPIVMADLFLFNSEPDLIIWTAHLVRTALETFKRIVAIIESSDELSGRVKEIIESKAEQSIELLDGSMLAFFARSAGGGKGFGGKRLVFDESWALQAAPMGALIPTLSARANPQIQYLSSAEPASGDHQRALRARGRRMNDPSIIVIDYKAPGSWDDPGCAFGASCTHIYQEQPYGCVFDNEDYWRMANHAIGEGRITLRFVRAERRTLCQTLEGVYEFGRERLGWGELGGVTLDPDRIPLERWNAQADPDSRIVGPVVFAIDMPPSQQACSIAVAGNRADGTSVHFGVIEYRRGSSWAVPRLAELMERHETLCAPIWNPTGPVKLLRSQIAAAGIQMTPITNDDMAEACGAFKEHIMAGDAWHIGTETLDNAFKSSERRVTAEGAWVWGRVKSGMDISPVYAVTEAVFGVDTFGGIEPNVYSY